MKGTKKAEKTVCFDLEIHANATKDEWERYDAALCMISVQLFIAEIGCWGGRETCLGEPEEGYVRTNYWFVLESGVEKAKQEIERIIANFNLVGFTCMKIGQPVDGEKNYSEKFKQEKVLKWQWYKY